MQKPLSKIRLVNSEVSDKKSWMSKKAKGSIDLHNLKVPSVPYALKAKYSKHKATESGKFF